MPKAARLADPVSHTYADVGYVGGAAVGGFVGALVGTAASGAIMSAGAALIGAEVVTCVGAALVAAGPVGWLIGAVAIGAAIGIGMLASNVGRSAGKALGEQVTAVTGAISPSCSPNVKVNGKPSARCTADKADCSGPPLSPPHPQKPLIQGSGTVFINSMPAVRAGDMAKCSAKVSDGSSNVNIGGPQVTTEEPESEISSRAEWLALGAELAGGFAAGFTSLRKLLGHPIDGFSGANIVQGADFSLPTRVPLEWNRTYSSQSSRIGHLGFGWECPADFRLEFADDHSVSFWYGELTPIKFLRSPRTDQTYFHPQYGASLTTRERTMEIQTRDGLIYSFNRPGPGRPPTYVHRINDSIGNSLEFRREGNILTEVRDSHGIRLECKTRDSLIEEITLHHPAHPSRVLVSYEYSANRELLAVLDPLGNRATHEYSGGLIVCETSRNGIAFNFEYEQSFSPPRCTRASGPNGLFDYRFAYDVAARITRYTDSLGHRSELSYDGDGFLLRETNPLGETIHHEYDRFRRESSITDPLGRRTSYIYDDRANPVAIERPDGVAIANEYDASNCLTQHTDAAGHVWKNEWDDRRRLTRRITPLGYVHEYSYDQRGDLIAYKNQRGAVTHFERDTCTDGVVGTVDPLGHHVSWELDPLGRITRYVDQVGAVTDYELDNKGRVAGITRPTGAEVHCGYDREMNLAEYRDELGHVTRFDYCGLNKLAARHLPDGSTVRYEYDTEERLTGVVNGRGERYRLDRDPAGRVVRRVDYWDAATELRHNAAGEVIFRLDPLTRLTTYDRDLLGRLRARAYSDGTEERFTYDPLGNLVEFANADARAAREFDAEGRLLRERQNDFQVEYTYDPAGNCARRTSSAGNTVEYGYDSAGNFNALTVNGRPILEIQHDPRGLPIRERVAESLDRHREFDREGRMLTQQLTGPSGVISRIQYDYDARGDVLQRRDHRGSTDNFSYDPLSRLVRHQDPEGAIREFLRDSAGDFVQADASEATPLATESSPLRLSALPSARLSRTVRRDGRRYRFDNAGNVTEIRSEHDHTSLFWSAENRLTRARTPTGVVAHYRYDSLGRRVEKRLGEDRTRFAWDGDALLAENTEDGWREYIYAPGTFVPLAIAEAGHTQVFENETNGAPTQLISTDGNTLWECRPGAWGEVEVLDHSRLGNSLRLQGQYRDEETGLHYNRFRFYEPRTGGFLSIDPLGLAVGENLYCVAPSTWAWIDPLGLSCVPPAGNAAKGSQLTAEELAGKTRTEIRDLANQKGLKPTGDSVHPDFPRKWKDPVTGEDRLRLDRGHVDPQTGAPYSNPNAAVDHVHGYESGGDKIKINGDPHIPTKGD